MNNNFLNIYNNLIKLTRNKILYKNISNNESFSDRLIMFLLHFAFFLKLFKNQTSKKNLQNLYDYIFRQIELSIREVGYGDASINKRMKEYDIVFSRKQTYWLNDENGLIPEDMKLFTTKTINDEKTIDYLNDVFNLKFNTKKRINVSNKMMKINISSELRSKIENFYSEDCELYEKIKNSLK